MKRLFYFLSLFVLAFSLSLTTACKSDDDSGDGGGGNIDCVNYQNDQAFINATNAYTNAVSTWANDQSKENCDALIASLRDLIAQYKRFDSCVDAFTPDEKKQYEDGLNMFEANVNDFEANGCS